MKRILLPVVMAFVYFMSTTGCAEPEYFSANEDTNVVEAKDITATTVSLTGRLQIEELSKFEEIGVVYTTAEDFQDVTSLVKLRITSVEADGNFTLNVTGLIFNTEYKYAIYSYVNGICCYGEIQTFTTLDVSVSVTSVETRDFVSVYFLESNRHDKDTEIEIGVMCSPDESFHSAECKEGTGRRDDTGKIYATISWDSKNRYYRTFVRQGNKCVYGKIEQCLLVDFFYDSVDDFIISLNTCYGPLAKIYRNCNFWIMTEGTSDLIYSVLKNSDSKLAISPTEPGVATTVWSQAYKGVRRTNEILVNVQMSTEMGYITIEESHGIIAEAIVLRSFYYYILTCVFGGVPFYSEQNIRELDALPRNDASQIRHDLVDELLYWLLPKMAGGMEALPLVRTFDQSQVQRAGAALGLMLAGKMAMWNEDWETAIQAFSVLEDIYGSLEYYDLSTVPFGCENALESIWEVSGSDENNAINNGQLVSFILPPFLNGRYDGISIPEIEVISGNGGKLLPTKFTYKTLLPYNSDDLRAGEYFDDSDLPRCGAGTLAWRWKDATLDSVAWFDVTETDGTKRPWLGNKFWSSQNYKVFRYAGVILGLSEAWCELGDYNRSVDYLNQIKVRARVPKITVSSEDVLMSEIQDECAKELFGEFNRKFDLVRWGIWYDRVVSFNGYNELLNNIRPCHEYYPIPAAECVLSGWKLDNPEYNQ